MVLRRKAKGGVGTNQYRVRGQSQSDYITKPANVVPVADLQQWAVQCAASLAHAFQRIQDPECTGAELAEFSNVNQVNVRRLVAQHPNCPLAQLAVLTRDQDSGVRFGVASNDQCPSRYLHRLAHDPNGSVRAQVSIHPHCPDQDRARLAKDLDPVVRAAHPDTGEDELGVLGRDLAPAVRMRVAANPHCPVGTLIDLAADHTIEVRAAVLANPVLPDHVRAVLVLGGA